MADPAITLPKIDSLAVPVVDSAPSVAMTRIEDLPDTRTMAPLPVAMPVQPVSQDWSQVPSATVTITARAPVLKPVNTGIVPPLRLNPLPLRPPSPPSDGTPWWKDPIKLGIAGAALLVLLVLTKKE